MSVKKLYEAKVRPGAKIVFVVHGSYAVDTSDILGTFSDETIAREHAQKKPFNKSSGVGYFVTKLVLDGLQEEIEDEHGFTKEDE